MFILLWGILKVNSYMNIQVAHKNILKVDNYKLTLISDIF